MLKILLTPPCNKCIHSHTQIKNSAIYQKKIIKHPNRELQDVEPCTQDPSDSQPLISSFLSPPTLITPTETHTYIHTPRLGGERILKTNKQRIDLLRRIAEVLITSDPSPPPSKNAASLLTYSPLHLCVNAHHPRSSLSVC